MIVHFICRGNSFRSIIAEAYLNSLEIRDSAVLSSGTAAALNKAGNLTYYRITLELLEKHGIRQFAKAGYGDQLTQSRVEKADINVCMNQRVYDDSLQCVTFPASPRIWSVADVGEPGRIARTESESRRYREEAYQEIVMNVDQLISDISAISLSARVRSSRAGSGSVRKQTRPGRQPQALPGTCPVSPQTWQSWLVRLTDRLSLPQRIVIVIALGMAFGVAGIYLVNLGSTAGGGWYAYAPLSAAVYSPQTGLAGWVRLIIWLALTGLWALVSIRVLRPSQEEPPHD